MPASKQTGPRCYCTGPIGSPGVKVADPVDPDQYNVSGRVRALIAVSGHLGPWSGPEFVAANIDPDTSGAGGSVTNEPDAVREAREAREAAQETFREAWEAWAQAARRVTEFDVESQGRTSMWVSDPEDSRLGQMFRRHKVQRDELVEADGLAAHQRDEAGNALQRAKEAERRARFQWKVDTLSPRNAVGQGQ